MPHYVRTLLVTGPPEEVEAAAERHRVHVRTLRAEGHLHVAGEFPNGDGFLEIFEARDRVAAERIARSSPLVEEGLGSWMLREWIEID
jgi:uncharacterized protein YciI